MQHHAPKNNDASARVQCTVAVETLPLIRTKPAMVFCEELGERVVWVAFCVDRGCTGDVIRMKVIIVTMVV